MPFDKKTRLIKRDDGSRRIDAVTESDVHGQFITNQLKLSSKVLEIGIQ